MTGGDEKKVIRVLHIFAPNFKERFGGPIYEWKFYFSHWSNSEIIHTVLEYPQYKPADAKSSFSFELSRLQKLITRKERFIWLIRLFLSLIKHKKDYDLLHVHVLWWTGLLVGLWAKWNNIPAIYHSVLLYEDTPGGIQNEVFGKVKVRLLMAYKSILAISDALADDYLRSGFSESQVYKLMSCVDTSVFFPISVPQDKNLIRYELGLPSNAKILLFVGSLIERKGVDVLLQAFARVATSNSNLYLLIVGPRNKSENPTIDLGYVKKIYITINDMGLHDRVFFLGKIDDRVKLSQIYRDSDAFVFPSKNEGLPNVILEAMACGLPVIASQLPVLEKVITHKENGYFVPIGDVGGLIKGINALCDNQSLSVRMGGEAVKYIDTNHSFENWQTRLSDYYKNLFAEKKERIT